MCKILDYSGHKYDDRLITVENTGEITIHWDNIKAYARKKGPFQHWCLVLLHSRNESKEKIKRLKGRVFELEAERQHMGGMWRCGQCQRAWAELGRGREREPCPFCGFKEKENK